MNNAGIKANGSQDLPPAVATAVPGAVDTNSGGPSSAAAGGAAGASVGTGITDCSVAIPFASGARGRTGRHITTVVVWAAALATGFGFTRRTRCTTFRGAVDATFLGATFLRTTFPGAAFFLTTADARFVGVILFRTLATGAFFAGATTGEHSTSESTDALRTAGF